ncbi:cytochrome-c oxidase, cbb3-type subunit III [Alcanivorax sp. DP30]|uniref:cytochrome-c oxidase, cbb3-type subunit III n=1 Tax=Alcanivorax sp. DP30 TaxID=2606217 RepID=UPI00136FC7A3|nr:cytochrome-c oxidase, cbb3-type subunit III [Alcanivorax sp. DP30]MZR61776.1 cytochrome-c oxidase, cbb3-type subunit III [Alcanivorax sp. DP30]
MSDFWSWFIIVIVVFNLLGCAGLLLWNKSISPEEAAKETTGHTFDGIVERNSPLPRWWLGLFIGTLIFACVYLALYPGLGKFEGVLGWTSTNQYESEVSLMERKTGPLFDQYAQVPIEELIQYPEALAVGGRLFSNNCAICHGSDARGAKGYPNLTDDDWLYGGEPAQIVTSITAGRNGMMPPMAAAIGGTDEAIRDMAIYVQSLSRPEVAKDADKAAAIERAKPKFMVCAACHGPDGSGNQMLGAPNLTDTVWLYGPRIEDIEQTIREGRSGNMPAHESLLSEERIHVIASYVYSLSRAAQP